MSTWIASFFGMKVVQWGILGAIFAAIIIGLPYYTLSKGHSVVIEMASERGLCSSANCHDGVGDVYEALGPALDYSPWRIDWCLGVDEIAAIRVQRGGWLKSLVVEVMYLPCAALLVPRSESSPSE